MIIAIQDVFPLNFLPNGIKICSLETHLLNFTVSFGSISFVDIKARFRLQH